MLAEAFVLLAFSTIALRLLPFAKILELASWPLRPTRISDPKTLPSAVGWAVAACARRAPWRAVCFPQGLAAQIMLRRRGIDSTLYYGAAPGPKAGLSAHVWVRHGLQDVIGCELANDFAVLAVCPPDALGAGPRS